MKKNLLFIGLIIFGFGILLYIFGNHIITSTNILSSNYSEIISIARGLQFNSYFISFLGFIISVAGALYPIKIEPLFKSKKSKFCPECGIKIDGKPKFCYDCGTKLR